MNFEIRDAAPSDAAFIARNILAGMGYDVFSREGSEECKKSLEALIPLCEATNTLYSYKRTRISTVNGVPTGSLTSYRGEEYLPLREYTWGEWGKRVGETIDLCSEPECFAEEFYLDTLAVLPEWRGQRFESLGVKDKTGHLLIFDALELAKTEGFKKASLIADSEKPKLIRYYSDAGFRAYEEMDFFGHPYTRMRVEL